MILKSACGSVADTSTVPDPTPVPEPTPEPEPQERAAIRKLATGMCANYDSDYGCLPLDCECYMLSVCWTGGYCKYFREAVLPLNPVLEATLTGREAPALEMCAACGKPFVPEGRQAYCSPACAGAARRKRQRGYMRKKRGGWPQQAILEFSRKGKSQKCASVKPVALLAG